MRCSNKAIGMAATACFIAAAPGADANEIAKLVCQDVGRIEALELLGDRDGHGIIPHTNSCRYQSGVMDGAGQTLESIWEWDKTTGALLAASGIARKPGATVVFQFTEGKIALTMTDGKPTGFTGIGKGRMLLASGAAAALAGTTFAWTIKSTGAGQFDAVWTSE